jgi:hypothetical protein
MPTHDPPSKTLGVVTALGYIKIFLFKIRLSDPIYFVIEVNWKQKLHVHICSKQRNRQLFDLPRFTPRHITAHNSLAVRKADFPSLQFGPSISVISVRY